MHGLNGARWFLDFCIPPSTVQMQPSNQWRRARKPIAGAKLVTISGTASNARATGRGEREKGKTHSKPLSRKNLNEISFNANKIRTFYREHTLGTPLRLPQPPVDSDCRNDSLRMGLAQETAAVHEHVTMNTIWWLDNICYAIDAINIARFLLFLYSMI